MSTLLLPEREADIAPPVADAAPEVREAMWHRYALVGLLVATAILYVWGLGASGWANSFYSAAVQAGTKSWKAFFFGSSDAANFITVDKPPASLWVMELSARIFGVNSWSILVPQALEGVAAVGLLYAAVKRWFGAEAGLLAGAVLALTPVAALMFRFNNPDAMLVLLLVGGAYAITRAVEDGSTKWLAIAGACVGFGFLAKMLQAFVVLPAFGLTYLVAAPGGWAKRVRDVVWLGVVTLLSAGWWVAIVELWPKSSRPYIGGSQRNSVLDLVFGYNGFGRLTGNETGSVGGGGQAGSQWGPTGWNRMFNSDFGAQASWLIPAALVLGLGAVVLTWRAVRTDRTRAALILWGGWLLTTAVVFSFGQGIIHAYYTVALGPAIGAVVGIGGSVLWKHRHDWLARGFLAAGIAAAAGWSAALLNRIDGWNSWLQPLVLVLGLGAAVAVLVGDRGKRSIQAAVLAAAIIGGLAGPAAYSVATAAASHTGAIPSAGPTGAGGGFGGGGQRGGFGGQRGTFTPPTGTPGATGAPTFGGGQAPGGRGGGNAGGIGGLLNGSTSTPELDAALQTDADQYTWAAAAIGSNTASGYQLSSGEPVMAIGGFNGSDPTPTLTEFQAMVSAGKVHWFIGGGNRFGGGQNGGSSTSSEISAWVQSTFTAQTIGSTTVYDLTPGS
ncbi:MAG: glycosyl transferase [Actinomycetia bacterium]|nr:glycosyl transferase [Actinomycetes bacterium]